MGKIASIRTLRVGSSKVALAATLAGSLAACGGSDPVLDTAATDGRASASFISSTAPAGTALPPLDNNLLFDWAERAYPELFPGRSPTLRSAPYDYRHYPASGNYVGVAGDDVFILGPVSNHQLQRVGARNDYRCQVQPSSCGGPGYARAGWTTRLSSLQHGVSGTITIVDARTLRVSDFSYDGLGPQVYVYLGSEDSQSAFRLGPAIGEPLQRRPYVRETFEVQLPPGHSLDNFKAVSIWCVAFNANFGSGTFGAAGLSSGQ